MSSHRVASHRSGLSSAPARLVGALGSLLGAAVLVTAARPAHGAHAIEVGVGWQNTGALRDVMKWEPAIQGSRKEVPVFASWTWVGAGRVYYAPMARINYLNFWSLGGGGNALGVTVAPAAFGVHLTRPPAVLGPDGRRGRWVATLEIALSLQIGGNVTPGEPQDPGVPDPDAYRAVLRADVAQGGVKPEHGFAQRYPLGGYSFAAVAVPLHLRVVRMISERVGAGFFFEVNPLLLEWTLTAEKSTPSSVPAYGYNFVGGLSMLAF